MPIPTSKPRWDAEHHELRLGEALVKRFRHRAPISELILAAFQEQGWPPRIDDPLRPRPGRYDKARLRNAVQALNRRLENHAIRFETVGRGLAISWRRED